MDRVLLCTAGSLRCSTGPAGAGGKRAQLPAAGDGKGQGSDMSMHAENAPLTV